MILPDRVGGPAAVQSRDPLALVSACAFLPSTRFRFQSECLTVLGATAGVDGDVW